MKAKDIIRVECTFKAATRYAVFYASGKTKEFNEYTLPETAKNFIIKIIERGEKEMEKAIDKNNYKNPFIIETKAALGIGLIVKRVIYTLI